jgi:hypothetical protein
MVMWLTSANHAGANIARKTLTSITSPASFTLYPTGVFIQAFTKTTATSEATAPRAMGTAVNQWTQGERTPLPKR